MVYRINAFSIVELLVVIAIMGLGIGLGGMAISGVMTSARLNQAVETLNGGLNTARQLAVTRNRDMEVRLLSFPPRNGQPGEARVRAIQIFEMSEDGQRKLMGNVRHFPDGAILSNSNDFTSLLQLASQTPSQTAPHKDPSIAGVGMNYTFRSFRFRPDGSANFALPNPLPSYHMTLVEERTAAASGLPPNFATIQIEPPTGATVIYRP
ncbi:MAG: Verru_Chthon cassette protein D [Verrucomicrobiia bacterium]